MRLAVFLAFAALLLGFVAHSRGAEYDEAYSIFLTAGDARPAWPEGVFSAGQTGSFYSGRASLGQISRDLKRGDVHPPLYFWLLEYWRRVFGPSWFKARLLSVLLSLGGLCALAWLAAQAEIPAVPALALTLLSYGFAYTSCVARGFALAQFLNLLGTALAFSAVPKARQGRALAAGLALGAASFANYLAVFAGLALLPWLGRRRPRLLLPACAGMLPFILLDASYFIAQRNSRGAQFAAFSLPHALALLTRDAGAALFGGLPLYAGSVGPAVTAALALLSITALALTLRRRHEQAPLFASLAASVPLGLLGLGIIFHNTPIEIRYLAFSLPFLALLLAPALPRPLLATFLIVQGAAIIGLATAPATMQPQTRAAREAARIPNALILLPFGNDGVGVPGPFIANLPGNARVELLRAGVMPDLSGENLVVLADLRDDDASREMARKMLVLLPRGRCVQERTELIQVSASFCKQKEAKKLY